MIDRDSAEHYVWGQGCDGWHLAARSGLSVVEERMPAGTSEIRHHHEFARQFFYVLHGVVSFEVDGVVRELAPRQGIEIAPGVPHRVFNAASQAAEFLVISSPSTRGDRIEDGAPA